jgi:hypothetical protein
MADAMADDRAAARSDEGDAPEQRFAYWVERDMALDHDHCFLCGVELDEATHSDEHVFPKWLLGEFDLYNERLNLLNGTHIPYRQLTIPCCVECNGFWLSQIEMRVRDAVLGGPEAVEALDRLTLCLWLTKIYYGLLFKELALPYDRSEPDGEAIISPELFSHLRDLHRVLQAARQRVRFNDAPASVFVFRAQVPDEPRARFDYRDAFIVPFLSLRLGSVVILASLLDWGAMEQVLDHPKFDAARMIELHPFQFAELSAYGIYTAFKFNRVPKYLIAGGPEYDEIIVMPLGGLSTKPVFDPFDAEEFAPLLAQTIDADLDQVYVEGVGLWTCITDEEGEPKTIVLGKEKR